MAHGTVVLVPAVANQLRGLQESSGFQTTDDFLQHLFALEEQHRSQQCLSALLNAIEQPWLENYHPEAVTPSPVQRLRAASVGVQVKLCCQSTIEDTTISCQLRTSSEAEDRLEETRSDDSEEESVPFDLDYGEEQEGSEAPVVNDAKDGEWQASRTRNDLSERESRGRDPEKQVMIKQRHLRGRRCGFSCKECGTKFKERSLYEEHLQTHGGDEPPKPCNYCPEIFPNAWRLKLHVSARHPEHAEPPRDKPLSEPILCHICGAAMKSRHTYQSHLRSHSDERPYKCPHCPKTFKWSSALGYHVRMHSDERSYSCHLCDKRYKYRTNLREHHLTHMDKKPFKCTLCSKGFTQKKSLNDHIREKHECPGEKPHKCPHCSKAYLRKSRLKEHMTKHHQNPGQAVTSEAKKPRSKRIRKKPEHAQMIDASSQGSRNPTDRPFKCPHCPKTFRFSSVAECHKRTHSDERPYSCNLCEKCFKDQRTLARHLIVHTVKKLNKCSYCGKDFKHKTSMDEHIREQHKCPGERPHKCLQCSKAYRRKHSLNNHVKEHHRNPDQAATTDTKELCSETIKNKPKKKIRGSKITNGRPYKCPHCPKTFTLSSAMRYHVNTHLDKPLYGCNLCEKRFKYRTNLTSHRFTHVGEKPHKCTHCSKDFKYKRSLNGHIREQHKCPGQRPHKCPHCSKTYRRKHSLNNHVKKCNKNPEEAATKDAEEPCSKTTQSKPEHVQKTNVLPHVPQGSENTEGRPYKCPHCPKTFRLSSTLQYHVKTHSDEPFHVYGCNLCEKRFKYRTSLASHRLTHVDEKPHKCTHCSKDFKYKRSLNEHVKEQHMCPDKRPHTCPHCSKTYRRKHSLNSHIKEHHQDPEQAATTKAKRRYSRKIQKKPDGVQMTSVISQSFKVNDQTTEGPLVPIIKPHQSPVKMVTLNPKQISSISLHREQNTCINASGLPIDHTEQGHRERELAKVMAEMLAS